MDRLAAMTLFKRVVETGSFSASAREAGLSQSSVSKQVAELEALLGTRLLQRTTRKLALTESGADYYAHCRRILADVEEAESSAGALHKVVSGTLRVAAPAAFGRLRLMPHIGDFLLQYPRLRLDVTLSDRLVDLVNAGIDVTVRLGQLADTSLAVRRLGRCTRLIAAASSYLNRRGTPTTLKALAVHDCIVLTETGEVWRFTGPSGLETVRVSGQFRTDSTEAMRSALVAGLGVAVVPHWLIAPELADGTLVPLLPKHVPAALDISALYPQTPRVPAKVRAFIDFFSRRLRDG